MSLIRFSKFHGFGNDYIVVESSALKAIEDIAKFAQRICARHTGAGADGVAIIEKHENSDADFSCRIINPDGGEAGFSGNGTRCAVAYLYFKDIFSNKDLKLKTKSGVKNYELLEREEGIFRFLAELGKPDFRLPDSDVFPKDNGENPGIVSIEHPADDDEFISFLYTNVGNPVVCFFVADDLRDFDDFGWRRIGAEVESYTRAFPERTNVVFIKILDRENIEIRIWERGAGETSSSGTCSIAAAVASAFLDKTARNVSVHAPGGTTEAAWREDGEMLITGTAEFIYNGEFWLPD